MVTCCLQIFLLSFMLVGFFWQCKSAGTEYGFDVADWEDCGHRPAMRRKFNLKTTLMSDDLLQPEIPEQIPVIDESRINSDEEQPEVQSKLVSRASPGQFPSYVQVLIDDGETVACGGVLIGRDSVLIGAHCFLHLKNATQVWLVLGSNSPNQRQSRAYELSRICLPSSLCDERHNITNLQRQSLDSIAVLQISQKIRYGSFVQPACLPEGPFIMDDYQSIDLRQTELADGDQKYTLWVTNIARECTPIPLFDNLEALGPLSECHLSIARTKLCSQSEPVYYVGHQYRQHVQGFLPANSAHLESCQDDPFKARIYGQSSDLVDSVDFSMTNCRDIESFRLETIC